MLKVEDLTSEQIDGVIQDLDKTVLLPICVQLQDTIEYGDTHDTIYVVPENVVAIQYCMAKTNEFVSEEHSAERYAEWDVLYNKVISVCTEINKLLVVE